MVAERNPAHLPYIKDFRQTLAQISEELRQCAESLAICRNAYYLTDGERASLESFVQSFFKTREKLKEFDSHFGAEIYKTHSMF